ncbi:PQQ-binding-like beta-propeller repeat protein [Actinoplanes sp. NPDC051861]|uniref:outer membrane protein assembly factor BamB family protein n=1 Tax=Actinoplanes sp. NPDC051861 TaxID=3155170 RepID=UPI0034351C4E
MATIELGDLTDAPPAPITGRPLPRLHLRQLAVAAVTLALLVCGASAPAGEPGVRRLWSGAYQPENILAVTGDALYVQNDSQLVAYDLDDGDVRWAWRMDLDMLGIRPVLAGGLVLVQADNDTDDATEVSHTTIALDAATGAEIWRRSGGLRYDMIKEDSALLVEYQAEDRMVMSRIGLADGKPYWTLLVPGMREIVTDPAGRLLVRTSTGDVSVLRYSDGKREFSRRIMDGVEDPALGRYISMSVDGGRLLVYHSRADDTYTTVHDLTTLDEVMRGEPGNGPLSGCGAVLCRFEDGRFVAVDPMTGKELWREPSSVVGLSMVADDKLMLDLSDGRMHVLVESRTGRQLKAGLGGTALLDQVTEDSLLLLRPSQLPAGLTAITRIDMATGAGDLLGAIPLVPDPQTCQTVPGYLVCPGADRFFVTAVRR